jgi:competence protein ComEA
LNQNTAGRTRAYVILCSAISLVGGGAIGYFSPHSQSNTPIVVSTPLPDPTSLPASTPASIRVHVSGAVRQPDVYELPAGSIVKDAVEAAGGPTGDANLDGVNLAVELRDQQQVYVPRWGETNPIVPAVGGGGAASGPININTATAAELETLPGIGTTMARNIIAYREANGPFETIEDIMDVPGIGEGKFEQIKDLITVGP